MRQSLRRAVVLALLAALAASVALGAVAPRKRSSRPPSAARARTPAAGTLSPLGRTADYDSTLGDSIREPRVFMAWHAPYGTRRAMPNLQLSCRDTVGEDTLFLSFETGRNLEGFYGVAGRLRFHPAHGETLGPFWQFQPGGANVGGIKAQIGLDPSLPCAQPWIRPGVGNLAFKYTPGFADLRYVYAVAVGQTSPVSAETRYCLARVIVDRRHCRLAGARQPVCVEWIESLYSGGGRDLAITQGERFVTINSPDGSVCVPYRRAGKVPSWVPKTAKPALPDTSNEGWEH